MSRYLVMGGAGRTGGPIVDRLVDNGHQVTVASRHRSVDPRPASDLFTRLRPDVRRIPDAR